MSDGKKTGMRIEEIEAVFKAYLEKFKEQVAVVGCQLIQRGVIAERPIEQVMLAIAQTVKESQQGAFDDEGPPDGVMFNSGGAMRREKITPISEEEARKKFRAFRTKSGKCKLKKRIVYFINAKGHPIARWKEADSTLVIWLGRC